MVDKTTPATETTEDHRKGIAELRARAQAAEAQPAGYFSKPLPDKPMDAPTNKRSKARSDDTKNSGAASEGEILPKSKRMLHRVGDEGITITDTQALSKSAWDAELFEAQHKPWNTTIPGRGLIRLFSRGVLGATFFALGSRYARETLATYHPEREIDPNITHLMARGVDKFIGKPLEKLVTAMGHDGKAFVTFRPTRMAYNNTSKGFTLGHELVGLTFDFASMSVGDALGRDIANQFDPNTKLNWIDDKGHLDYKQMVTNIGRSAWQYFTFNAGEDWAVSLPYTFFVRWQRNLIDKVSPGFAYDADRRLNGGSFKIDNNGKVIGTYGLEGAIDLQTRFTVYNIGTVMFREAYSEAEKWLKQWKQDGFKLPEGPASVGDAWQNITGMLAKGARWTARDAIKATLYMTPAMPAFWLFRTPQTKYKGLFINQEKGLVTYRSAPGVYDIQAVHAHEAVRSSRKFVHEGHTVFTPETPTFYSHFDGKDWSQGESIANPLAPYMRGNGNGNGTDKFPTYSETRGTFDSLTNPLGKVNNALRKKGHTAMHIAEEAIEHATQSLGMPMGKVDLDNRQLRGKSTLDNIINASFAYTPYFFMKSDVMAPLWDRAKTDMAIERFIDGATHFNASEAKAGIKETWQALWHKPFDDPARELAAQKAICNDTSPPDGQTYNINARCLDEAVQDIQLYTEYQKQADTGRFADRLADSRTRSKKLLDEFKEGEARKFADALTPASRVRRDPMTENPEGFVNREQIRKAKSLADFPFVSTTLH